MYKYKIRETEPPLLQQATFDVNVLQVTKGCPVHTTQFMAKKSFIEHFPMQVVVLPHKML